VGKEAMRERQITSKLLMPDMIALLPSSKSNFEEVAEVGLCSQIKWFFFLPSSTSFY
jgi:hypothetical protein